MITNKQDRSEFIGGSEANYIYLNYHTDSFKAWWYNKLMGLEDAPFNNLNMAVGTILEHEVLDLFEQINNVQGKRDQTEVKGIARANTDYIIGNKISDVKVSKKAKQWHDKGKVPINYKRQLIHYLYVCNKEKASIIAYQCDEDLLQNPFQTLTEGHLYEIEVQITQEEINAHREKIEFLEYCKGLGIYPT